MTKEIWVTHTLYERNADDGIEYFTNRDRMAEAVNVNESAGGEVQVYRCVPVHHEIYHPKIAIHIEDVGDD